MDANGCNFVMTSQCVVARSANQQTPIWEITVVYCRSQCMVRMFSSRCMSIKGILASGKTDCSMSGKRFGTEVAVLFLVWTFCQRAPADATNTTWKNWSSKTYTKDSLHISTSCGHANREDQKGNEGRRKRAHVQCQRIIYQKSPCQETLRLYQKDSMFKASKMESMRTSQNMKRVNKCFVSFCPGPLLSSSLSFATVFRCDSYFYGT